MGPKKNVCPPETSIYILFLTVLLIPEDGQRQVDKLRHRNFAIWSIGTQAMPVLVKNCTKIISFELLRSNTVCPVAKGRRNEAVNRVVLGLMRPPKASLGPQGRCEEM